MGERFDEESRKVRFPILLFVDDMIFWGELEEHLTVKTGIFILFF